ncbi:unnamed protein product [Cuscuta campestris]|uniref:Transposase (putative) gypsy type domain-containing protein n=1 Tax=Cuscuta campestris TaxID=132261 RepID=A0A484N2H9_9ASTE|nr:unnamed protein product [Cuscuta campestris]
MPGQVFMEGDEPVDGQPAPYDPDTESWLQWEERLEAAGYSPLPTFYVSDIYPHVSKIALNKARRNLPEGYVLEYDENWPNIIEPHREDMIGFHITSLEGGILFPLRPLLVELCYFFRILPGQITPNAHRLLNSFVNICHHLHIDPSLRLFLYVFEVRPGKSGCEDMNFRSFDIPKKTGASSSAGPHTSSAKTVPVQQETVEIHSEEETPQIGEAIQTRKTTTNPPHNKGKGKTRTKKAATTHPSAKRKREEDVPVTQSLEELCVKMGLKLKEMGEVGRDTLEELAEGSPSRSSLLEEKVAGKANVEVLQLKEENTQLMGEVSLLKEDAELKEREFPGRARQWMGENLVEAARVLTSTPERTMEGFQLLYREERGKEMITAIGSFGFMSGQKRDREATHEILTDAAQTSLPNLMARPPFPKKSLLLLSP